MIHIAVTTNHTMHLHCTQTKSQPSSYVKGTNFAHPFVDRRTLAHMHQPLAPSLKGKATAKQYALQAALYSI